MRWIFVLAELCLAFAVVSLPVHGQANVNENLETASLYVDAVNGSDSNPGTQQQPLKTISEALALANTNNHNGIGTTIIVNPGIYREAISESYNKNATSLPITLEAATPGTAILTGADIFTGWTQYSGNSSIYTIPWTENYGFCPADTDIIAPYQAPIVLRREMVFINGALMTQVLDLSQMVYPGTFFVDDPNQTIYVWPPSGVDINSSTVEISTRGPEVNIKNYANFVLRGMTIQADNTCHNNSAVYVHLGSSNILLDNDTMRWNNSRGLNLQTANTSTPTQDVTVQNCQFLHNGQAGATDFRALNTLWQNDTFNYNNWRGALGSYYSWASSGMYYDQEHNSTVNNLTFLYNQTNGVHWDTDDIQITATGVIAAGNLLNGVFFEKNEGPITFTGGTIADNLPNPNVTNFLGGGVIFRNSEFIDFENTQVFGNGNAQLTVEGQAGGIPISNWQTGENYNVITSALTWEGDTIESSGATYSDFNDASLDGTDWTDFIAAPFTSTGNVWWNTQGNPTPFLVPEPSQPSYDDFAGWQAATGQDLGSVYQEPNPDPVLTYTLPPPDAPDYWLVVDNSLLNAAPDGTAVYNVYGIPLGSFTGTLDLSLVGVNDTQGLTGTISANSIGESGTAAVTLTAAQSVPAGTYEATVIANGGSLTHAVTFSIVVPTTFVRIVPATLAFPPTQSGFSSAPMNTTLTNYGTTTLAISSITMSSQWTETDTCNGAVAPGASCILSVTFTPNAAFSFVGTMIIADSDPTGTQVVTLTGTGTGNPLVNLSPSVLKFGPLTDGTDSTLSSVLSNTGIGTLNISGQIFGGNDPGDFSESDDCGGTVAPGASCTIAITFSPQHSGPRMATYTLSDNAPSDTQTLTLDGNGQTPIVQINPGVLSFGAVPLGLGESLAATLSNSGNGDLLITSINLSGANANEFTQTNTCGSTLPAGGSCTISVTFAPNANSAASATLVFTDNAPDSPQTVTLSGSAGASISFSPNPLLFPDQPVGQTSPAMGITVTNNLGTTLDINSQTIIGVDPDDYVITKICPATLGPGKSCVIHVVFTPSAVGLRKARLSLATNAPGSPQTDKLRGTGTLLSAQLSPTSLDFGVVSVGSTSAPQDVTLTNNGTLPLAITGMTFNGMHLSWFSETDNCGVLLQAGATCTISVTATPKSKSTGTTTLNVFDDAPDSPQQVALSVTGN